MAEIRGKTAMVLRKTGRRGGTPRLLGVGLHFYGNLK
jgi:hypothetical protein